MSGTAAPLPRIDPSRSLKERLARGAATAFVINACGTGLGFLTELSLARTLGVESYGIYAYVIAWVMILGLFATVGFQTALLRFVAAYRANEQWGLLRGILRYALLRVVLAGIGVAGIGAAIVMALGSRMAPELAHTFLFGMAVVPVLALLQVHSSIARAFGRVITALAPNPLVRHAVVLAGIGLLVLGFSWEIGAPLAMALVLLGTALGLVLVTVAARTARPRPLRGAQPAVDAAHWRRTSLSLLLLAGTQVVLHRADVIMLGFLADTTTAGIYAVAFRIAAFAAFALSAANMVFAPTIAALHAQEDRAGLQTTVTSVARWALAWALLVSLPLFVFAEFVLGIFGDSFRAGAPALRILLVGQMIGAAFGSVSLMMTMTGLERQATAVVAVAAIGCIVLHILLIPPFGIVGAASASALALMGWKLAMAVLVWKNRRITPGVLAS